MALCTMISDAKLLKALATNLLTMIRITDLTLVPGTDSIRRISSPKIYTTASSTKTDILAIYFRTLSSSAADQRNRVSKIIEK